MILNPFRKCLWTRWRSRPMNSTVLSASHDASGGGAFASSYRSAASSRRGPRGRATPPTVRPEPAAAGHAGGSPTAGGRWNQRLRRRQRPRAAHPPGRGPSRAPAAPVGPPEGEEDEQTRHDGPDEAEAGHGDKAVSAQGAGRGLQRSRDSADLAAARESVVRDRFKAG